ncbi:hypothetical protein BV20DRAFT_700532 [Pilatotrama ljubarskyi]|nr:hypothetical protein BV20DRAFT_700532 [Pilatotrama ljubarskyi]
MLLVGLTTPTVMCVVTGSASRWLKMYAHSGLGSCSSPRSHSPLLDTNNRTSMLSLSWRTVEMAPILTFPTRSSASASRAAAELCVTCLCVLHGACLGSRHAALVPHSLSVLGTVLGVVRPPTPQVGCRGARAASARSTMASPPFALERSSWIAYAMCPAPSGRCTSLQRHVPLLSVLGTLCRAPLHTAAPLEPPPLPVHRSLRYGTRGSFPRSASPYPSIARRRAQCILITPSTGDGTAPAPRHVKTQDSSLRIQTNAPA